MAANAAVYASSYRIYNEGSLFGKWFDLNDYSSLEELEKDIKKYLAPLDLEPEIMYQDFEGFPRFFYEECGLNDDLFEYLSYIEENPDSEDSLNAFIDGMNNFSIEEYENSYFGYFESYYELGEYLAEIGCLEIPENVAPYFNYESYGRDFSFDFHEFDNHYFWL